MHLEDRKGRLALVLEKALVDLGSVAFNVFKAHQALWLAAGPGEDHFRRPGPIRCDGNDEDRPITLVLNALTAPPRS
jgi:pyrophosphate--fructose-6-phosphate 1-phosphotransferase